ncbi:MAG: LL-diaminopimelate aminotransferase [Candidatus Omnitrophica bacterium]|nr:LL-diaminopimelate aminotransferase [Candidatus Omnitrophota bacterium]
MPPVARRLKRLPPYLFVAIDALKEELLRQGRDVIDMGVGDPDLPTPGFIRRALVQALRNPAHHRYPSNRGLLSLRQAIARWYQKRFQVALDPETEILPLIGSKEGIAHLPLGFVNPGDAVLVPDPGYPPYRTGTILAGGRPVAVPLLAQNDFLPDLEALQKRGVRAKLFFLNYPNNPTAACADGSFFRRLTTFAHKTGIPVCHDAAYSEISFSGPQPSFLQSPGAKEAGIEFHSLSKTFQMTGFRIGWVAGNRQMVSALARVKSNIDSGIFEAIQAAGIRALQGSSSQRGRMAAVYRRRRDLWVGALQSAGWPARPPEATFYLWVRTPPGKKSQEVSSLLLRKAGIVATPGVGFGRYGEGYIRFSLTLPLTRLQEAARRMGRLSLWPKPSSG